MSDTSHKPSCHIPECRVLTLHRHELIGNDHVIFLTGAGDFSPAKTDKVRELEAIRAFVERVEKRFSQDNVEFLDDAIQLELAAMEAEVKE